MTLKFRSTEQISIIFPWIKILHVKVLVCLCYFVINRAFQISGTISLSSVAKLISEPVNIVSKSLTVRHVAKICLTDDLCTNRQIEITLIPCATVWFSWMT